MSASTQEPEVLETEVSPSLPMQVGGTVDVQVATARRFPRSISTFIRRATEMATLTPEIAASCVYAMPRGGRTIEGPSARLAEIVAHAWGNLRIQAGATENDDRYITARGEAWDVESNVAIGFEVRRRITNSSGDTYNDDMITVTGNAAASIALRNAVFKAVPSSFWKPIYQKCRQVIAGDAKTFAARRDDMLKAFMVAGVTPERLCAGIGLKGVADITLDHMATLVGILNAIKEGETNVDDAFPEGGGVQAPPRAAQRKSEQAQARSPGGSAAATPVQSTPSEPAASASPAPSAPAEPTPVAAMPNVGTVQDIQEKAGGAFLIVLNTGFKCASTNKELVDALRGHRAASTIIELHTRAARKEGNAPVLEEIEVVTREPGADDA
jgi:cell division septation protein DedD